jgi:2'-5' RNA ligase
MSENVYKTVYLSLAIPLTNDLHAIQQQVCERYDLIPRSEMHLTIGFLGETTAQKLLKLADLLIDNLPSSAISELRVNGLGGAYQVAEKPLLIKKEKIDELQQFPRVLWISVNVPDELRNFRKLAKQAAELIGINTKLIDPDYFPHLTVGSAGPPGEKDWSLWDVHTVPKHATIAMPISLEKVQASKLHLTDVSIHPDSVHLLSAFPRETHL